MKAVVVYATKTGHSKKIAEAIGEALKIDVYNVKKPLILVNIDMLFIVGGIYGGKSAPELMCFVNSLESKEIKKAAVITSSASKSGTQADIKKLLADKGIETIANDYKCRGKFLFVAMGHPNSEEIAGAVEYAKQAINS